MSITACLIARDEADRIGPCLESLTWVDDIVVVVDAATTDETEAICRAAGARVFVREWPGFAAQHQFALDQATGEWTLLVAADERVTPELRDEITAVLAAGTTCDYFLIPVCNLFWNRRLTCRYPDLHPRLFRRNTVHIAQRLVHEDVIPNDPQAKHETLCHDILHDSFRGLMHYLDKCRSYAELGAQQLIDEGARIDAWTGCHHALGAFIKFQFLRGGYRDGAAGFTYNAVHAFYVFLKYQRAYEKLHVAQKEKR